MPRRIAIALLLAAFACLAGAEITPEQETQMGARLARETRAGVLAIDSPLVQQYVERLGSRIAPRLPGQRFQYTGECRSQLADGAACAASSECASGSCEGQGCGPEPTGTCVAKARRCTKDRRAFCGCDGKTFHGSSSCPGARYQATGACPGAGTP